MDFDGNNCIYETIYNAQITYFCNDGNLNGSVCEKKSGSTPMIEKVTYCDEENCSGHKTMGCPSGTEQISGNTCAYITRIPAEEKFECLQGGNLINTNTCRKEEIAKPTNIKHGCPNGYITTSNGKCEKLLTKETFKNIYISFFKPHHTAHTENDNHCHHI